MHRVALRGLRPLAALTALFLLTPAPAAAQSADGGAASRSVYIQFDHAPDPEGDGRFRVQEENRIGDWLPRLNELTIPADEPVCVQVLHPNPLLYSYTLGLDTLARSEPPAAASFVAILQVLTGADVSTTSLDTTRRDSEKLADRYLAGEMSAEEFAAEASEDAAAFDRVYFTGLVEILRQTAELNRMIDGSDGTTGRKAWAELASAAQDRADSAESRRERIAALVAEDPRDATGEHRWLGQIAPAAEGLEEQAADLQEQIAAAAKKVADGIELCREPEGDNDVRVTLSARRTDRDSTRVSWERPRGDYRFTVRREDTSRFKVVPLVTFSTFYADRVDAEIAGGELRLRDGTSAVEESLGTALLVRAAGPLWGMIGASSLEPDEGFGTLMFGLALHLPDVLNFTLGAGASYASVPVGLSEGFSEGPLPGDAEAPALDDVVNRDRRLGLAIVVGLAGLSL